MDYFNKKYLVSVNVFIIIIDSNNKEDANYRLFEIKIYTKEE